MSNKRKKAKKKRWYKERLKEQERKQWAETFRNHFIKVGILKGEPK